MDGNDAGLISVIIPTYNRSMRVCRAIKSALGQTYTNIEVLVVDDGSRDDTWQVIQDRFSSDSRVRYVYKENGGVSSARNFGLKAAQGRFIAFLDSDDVWLPNKLALQLKCFEAFPRAGMVWSDMDAVDASENLIQSNYLRTMYGTYQWFPRSEDIFTESTTIEHEGRRYKAYCGDIFAKMALGNLVHTSTVLLRKEVASRTGIFREDFRKGGEDYDFHLRTTKLGPVAFIDAVTIHYTIGEKDALTNPGNRVDISKAFIETLSNTLKYDRDRIDLPRSTIRQCLARGYAWAARECLVVGQVGDCRKYFLRNLLYCPWDYKALVFLLVSFLPAAVRTQMIEMHRKSRKTKLIPS